MFVPILKIEEIESERSKTTCPKSRSPDPIAIPRSKKTLCTLPASFSAMFAGPGEHRVACGRIPAALGPLGPASWQCLAHHKGGSQSWSLLRSSSASPPSLPFSQLQMENARRWSAFLADVSCSQPGWCHSAWWKGRLQRLAEELLRGRKRIWRNSQRGRMLIL